MRWRQLRWCLAGALGCVFAAPAQGRIPQGSDEERAREAMMQGRKALQEGRKEEAIERYRAAWELYKDPWYICDRGGLEFEIGRARDAAQSLSTCLRLLKPEAKQTIGPKAKRMLDEVRAQVGALTVEVNVPDAEVSVDGKVAGKLPLIDPIFVDPGSHAVEVKAPGYHADARVAVMHAGASMLIRMRLDPMRVEVAPLPPDRAPLEPKQEEAKSPSPAPLPRAAKEAPKLLRAPAKGAEPAREPARAAVILTGLGISIGGAVAGTAGFMAASTAREEAQTMTRALTENSVKCAAEGSDPCQDIDASVSKAMALTAVGVGGVAISAIGGALIIYELVRSAPQEQKPSTRVAVVVSPGGGALKVAGSF